MDLDSILTLVEKIWTLSEADEKRISERFECSYSTLRMVYHGYVSPGGITDQGIYSIRKLAAYVARNHPELDLDPEMG